MRKWLSDCRGCRDRLAAYNLRHLARPEILNPRTGVFTEDVSAAVPRPPGMHKYRGKFGVGRASAMKGMLSGPRQMAMTLLAGTAPEETSCVLQFPPSTITTPWPSAKLPGPPLLQARSFSLTAVAAVTGLPRASGVDLDPPRRRPLCAMPQPRGCRRLSQCPLDIASGSVKAKSHPRNQIFCQDIKGSGRNGREYRARSVLQSLPTRDVTPFGHPGVTEIWD